MGNSSLTYEPEPGPLTPKAKDGPQSDPTVRGVMFSLMDGVHAWASPS